MDRAVARLFAARARQEAVALNRDGDYERRPAAPRRDRQADPRVRRATTGSCSSSSADASRTERSTFEAPMAEPMLKQAHYASANVLRSRDAGRTRSESKRA